MIEIISNNDLSLKEKIDENNIRTNLSETFFNNIKIKYLRKMIYTTPEDHRVTCYISKKPNYQLGSMVITNVDGVECRQYVQGMPKIKYWEEYVYGYPSFKIPDTVREKLDGTNILFYFLRDPSSGEVLEVLSKTRNMPLLADDFQELFNNLPVMDLLNMFCEYDGVFQSVAFELYGEDNLHDIHYHADLNLRLLTAFDTNGEQISSSMMGELSKTLGVRLPADLFNITYFPQINKYIVTFTPFAKARFNIDLNKLETYINQDCNTVNDVYKLISNILEEINNFDKNTGAVIEGVVITNIIEDETVLMKNKPPSIKENHTCRDGVPSKAIRKEVQKFIDDLGKSRAIECMKNSRFMVDDYLESNLLEEFSLEKIRMSKTQKRIDSIIEGKISSSILDPEVENMAIDLVKSNPDLNINDLMREFAVEYPDLKKLSRVMFNALKKELNKS